MFAAEMKPLGCAFRSAERWEVEAGVRTRRLALSPLTLSLSLRAISLPKPLITTATIDAQNGIQISI